MRMSINLARRFLNRKLRSSKYARKMCTERVLAENTGNKCDSSPVMINEVIENINLKEGNLFLDMTFGAGGHSSVLLETIPNLRVIALDRDPAAQTFADELRERYPDRFTFLLGRFSELPELLQKEGIKRNRIDGVLIHLGCSPMQSDCSERGFSSSLNGPLDMRMDGNRVEDQITAADLVAHANEAELLQIFKRYGNEKKSLKIARAIVEARYNLTPPKTTKQLCDLLEVVCDSKRIGNIVSNIFYALRVFVNNEINELNYGISVAQRFLNYGGRALTIAYHLIEDEICKKHFNNLVVDNCVKPVSMHYINPSRCFDSEEIEYIEQKYWKVVHKKVIVPTEEELSLNPRSKNAKLRVAAKI